MKCSSCGASVENISNKSTYKCEYCGSYNYDEKYIEQRFANLNPTKAIEILGVAKVRFASARYDEAVELITESLKENNDCVEAWACLAACRIYTLSTSNFDKNIKSIEQCMIKIKNLDNEHFQEFFIEIHQKLLEKTIKLSEEWIQKSSKVYVAYASTNINKAKESAGHYSLLAINMINKAHQINNEFTEPSVKASIYILFAIFNLDELKEDPRFNNFKSNAQDVVQSALTKNETSTNKLITNLGLTPSVVLSYLKNKSKSKVKTKKSGGKKWLFIFAVIVIFIIIIANSE